MSLQTEGLSVPETAGRECGKLLGPWKAAWDVRKLHPGMFSLAWFQACAMHTPGKNTQDE